MLKGEKVNQIEQMNRIGDKVFLSPNPLLSYDNLAKCSLGSNTYRGFHRKDTKKPGAASIFKKFLMEKRSFIQSKIKEVKSEIDLDNLLKELCNSLLAELRINIRADQLISFNKIRKPVDIVIQHMIAMGEDFNSERTIITNLLFLPLDSQIFQSGFIFTDQEAKNLSIKRNYTFKDIRCESHYSDIQVFLKEKAKRIKLNHRIYFDLVWKDRYKSRGTNLFLTNPN